MAAIWPGSRTTYFNTDGTPAVGYQLYFYDEGTTTPQVVYSDAALSVALDQPVESDSRGMFQAIFMNSTPGTYRVRMYDDASALIFDDDGVSVYQSATYVAPAAGTTDPTLLFATGDYLFAHRTSAKSGWVRAAGRTIGSATSGATERANADCEDLFLLLWAQDTTLSVSTGRGATAAADWAANKTIALPDVRERVLAGMATMGNSDAGIVADTYVDGGETTSTLGATAGADDVTLTEAQMPTHTHTATFTGTPLAAHSHTISARLDESGGDSNIADFGTGTSAGDGAIPTSSDSAGTPAGTVSVANKGSSSAHTNMQPSLFATCFIKL